MAKRQRLGWWFLCLACVVVMVCTAQRMAGLHALQMNTVATSVVTSEQAQPDEAAPVTPCELSAKSLLAAPPVLFEGIILALCLLLSLLAPVRAFRLPFSHREPSRHPLSGYIFDFASSVNDRTAVADC